MRRTYRITFWLRYPDSFVVVDESNEDRDAAVMRATQHVIQTLHQSTIHSLKSIEVMPEDN